MKRGSGILLHISSLPSRYGIGDLGRAAYQFVDFLSSARQNYWQLLPLNPTDVVYGNSPYSSISAFATNVLFIDPEYLVKEGWLAEKELFEIPSFPEDRVDYQVATKWKVRILTKAYAQSQKKLANHAEYQRFCKNNDFWLNDYALFINLKEHFQGQIWNKWTKPYRARDTSALEKFCEKTRESIEKVKFFQYVFFQQWLALKSYCTQKNIQLIGDIPIYVNYDSADVWGAPKIFKLDQNERPLYVAGVPPDYFSKTGQRWGNPVYDWEQLKKDSYDWWMKRIRHNLTLFDIIRIDHFRGLVGYWQIPVKEKTAVKGQWVSGPGDDFFEALKRNYPQLPIIAEDLGVITPDVTDAMQKFGFPGMKVLLFAFDGDLDTHPYIPKNYPENCVAYTGTHDNNTVRGWLENDAKHNEKENLSSYLGKDITPNSLPWELIRLIMLSRANLAINPLQDFLGLGAQARMNTPATTQRNWQWRVQKKALTANLSKRIAALTQETHRS